MNASPIGDVSVRHDALVEPSRKLVERGTLRFDDLVGAASLTVWDMSGKVIGTATSSNGLLAWNESIASGDPATAGQVMIAALPIIIGFQLLLAFLQYDITSTPTEPLGSRLQNRAEDAAES